MFAEVPVLREVGRDFQVPWQWWRNSDYLAGFSERDAAERYGIRHGWLQPARTRKPRPMRRKT